MFLHTLNKGILSSIRHKKTTYVKQKKKLPEMDSFLYKVF